MKRNPESSNNQTHSLPDNAHKEMTTDDFYELLGEKIEDALSSQE